MESGNGNGTGTGTGYGTRNRLLKTEDALMVHVLTIVTCSKNWTLEINLHQYASFFWSLSFSGKWNIHGEIS